MESQSAPQLLPTASQLHKQTGPIKLPFPMKGSSSTAVFKPSDIAEVKHYLSCFRDVRISGPFSLSVRGPISAKISYNVDVAVIPEEYINDYPKGSTQVCTVPGSGSAFLSNLAPPSSTSLVVDDEITFQLKPKPLDLAQPLFVVFWESEGTKTDTLATCFLHCNVTVAGKGFVKTWNNAS